MNATLISLTCLTVLSAVSWHSVQPAAQDEQPRVVTPGSAAAPPSDAIVLFNGTDMTGWKHPNGKPAGWKVEGGTMQVNGSGSVITEREFGDCQLHLEFRTPSEVSGNSQGRGNSGVYVAGRYEVQVLDSYQNETYPNGQCGAVYSIAPPLVNACRAPGEWQSYDIIYHGPQMNDAGEMTASPTLTVFHNGVLIQDHVAVTKPTTASMIREHGAKGPIYLQDHGNPVQYRNVWLREL